MRTILQCYDTGNYSSWQNAGNCCAVYELDVTHMRSMLTSEDSMRQLEKIATLGAECLGGGARTLLRFRLTVELPKI